MAKKNTNAITRPEELANAIGVSGKVVRAYLRSNFTRPANAKNTSWTLTPKMVAQTREHFAKRQSANA